MQTNGIEIEAIGKHYGTVEALRGFSLSVSPGELVGIIGPDGSGKTTLFRILTTLLLPDSGSATVCGYDVVRDYKIIRRIIGYMPGRFSLYSDLSVEENLSFFATIFQTTIEENYDLIRDIYVQIEPFKKRRAGKLSGGMKQKLALCCALIHRPEVLFLDEPTTGVDPVSRVEFWEMLARLKQQGMTILVSTPYMDEATRCDRIALVRNGYTLSVDTPQGICRNYRRTLLRVQGDDLYRLLPVLRSYPEVYSCYLFGDSLHVALQESEKEWRKITEKLQADGHNQIVAAVIEPSVEDCFMALGEEAI